MNGYLMKPAFCRRGLLVLGPVQFNWYNGGFRVHITWPVQRTIGKVV